MIQENTNGDNEECPKVLWTLFICAVSATTGATFLTRHIPWYVTGLVCAESDSGRRNGLKSLWTLFICADTPATGTTFPTKKISQKVFNKHLLAQNYT